MSNQSLCKISFKPRGTINFQTYKIDRFFSFFLGRLIIVFFWLIGILGLAGIVYSFISDDSIYFSLGLKDLIIFAGYKIMEAFYRDRLKRSEILPAQALGRLKKGEEINGALIIEPELFRALHQKDYSGKDIAKHLIDLPELKFILARADIKREEVHQKLSQELTEVGTREQVLYKALEVAQIEGHQRIKPGDLLVALCLVEPAMKELVFDLGLETADLLHIVYWYNEVRKKPKQFLGISGFTFTGGIGKDWVFGYTRFLNRYSIDLTTQISGYIHKLKYIGHTQAIQEMEKGLAQFASHNVVLVGEEGSGKRTTVFGLARKMLLGQSFNILSYRHLLEVDIEGLLAGAETSGAVIQRLSMVLSEAARAGNIILYFDNITNLFSSKGAGQVNAAEVLIPYLNSSEVFIIGTASPGKYHRYIQSHPSLSEKFKKVELKEPSQDEMIRIMEDTIPLIEQRTSSFFTYEALKEILKITDKYIFDQPNPQKSITLMDKVAVESRGETISDKKVQEVASRFYKIPVGTAGEEERKKLLNLEEELHKRIINQDLAITEISEAMRRARAGIGRKGKKPIGGFLFLGPTGVGKTETAKALAANYFGDEEAMFRFDMSEFQNKQDLYRLLGSPEEGGRPGLLTQALKERPFSLLLFDEIEKANPDILNLFLQILDEGQATDTQGNKLVFKNTIIIGTSNAGAEYIREQIKAGIEAKELSEKLIDYLLENNLFRPEFINRFTAVISFSPLSQEQIEQISQMKIDQLIQRIAEEKDIAITIGPKVVSEIARLGYNPEMGARPMERAIKKYLENLIAKKILAEEVDRGSQLTVTLNDLER